MKKKQTTIQQKLTRSYFILVFILLLITGLLILPAQLKQFNTSLEDDISRTGYLLSKNSQVINDTKNGLISVDLQNTLSEITAHSSNIDYIVIVNKHSIRLYHPNLDEIGQPFVGGDEQEILDDATPYITTRQGRSDLQKRSFHQIRDTDGTVLGFIMVSASLSTVHTSQYHLIYKMLLIFIILLLIGFLFSLFTAKKIRHSLLGYEPDTFTKMFLQREDILDNLDEGILAYDLFQTPLYANPSAKELLGEHLDLSKNENTRSLLTACMKERKSFTSLPFERNGNSLLLSLIPIYNKKDIVGSLIMIRDRTEALQLAEQLTGTTHIIDALRASTHEFLNKLHIISGMLQMENYEQALAFINGIASETSSCYQTIIHQIHNKTIAALLLGKQSHAKELAIDFVLQKDSYLDAHNSFLSTQELVTIVGNLIENAFHAIEDLNELRQVQLFICQTTEGLTIVSDDTGCGMTDEQIQKILSGNFTTRGEGHGIGLRLIQEIVKKHHGYLTIESEPGIGSSFTISLSNTLKEEHSYDQNSNR